MMARLVIPDMSITLPRWEPARALSELSGESEISENVDFEIDSKSQITAAR